MKFLLFPALLAAALGLSACKKAPDPSETLSVLPQAVKTATPGPEAPVVRQVGEQSAPIPLESLPTAEVPAVQISEGAPAEQGRPAPAVQGEPAPASH